MQRQRLRDKYSPIVYRITCGSRVAAAHSRHLLSQMLPMQCNWIRHHGTSRRCPCRSFLKVRRYEIPQVINKDEIIIVSTTLADDNL